MLKDILPARARQHTYRAYAVLVVLLGATFVGFATAGAAVPLALVVAKEVLFYLGGALGFVAGANVVQRASEKHRNAPLGD